MSVRKLLAWILVVGIAGTVPVVGQGQRKKRKDQPDVVVVQHILISFGKKLASRKVDRTKRDAAELAEGLLRRARSGESFDALVKEHTDDRYPGIYRLTNRGVPLVPDSKKREEMVVAFGDVAFSLEVGEVGLARYHGGNSPYGWHVIKRLE